MYPNPTIFEITPFLLEIERVLPSVTCPFQRTAIESARDFILETSQTNTPESPLDIDQTIDPHLLVLLTETLRYCGVAPAGWPPPPPPGERLSVTWVPVVDGLFGKEEQP